MERITTGGQVAKFSIGTSCANQITGGPDSALWFTDYAKGTIGRLTTDGTISYHLTSRTGTGAYAIAPGPDGALYFVTVTNCSSFCNPVLNRITTRGQISDMQYPGGYGSGISDLVSGPDGALWLVDAYLRVERAG